MPTYPLRRDSLAATVAVERTSGRAGPDTGSDLNRGDLGYEKARCTVTSTVTGPLPRTWLRPGTPSEASDFTAPRSHNVWVVLVWTAPAADGGSLSA